MNLVPQIIDVDSPAFEAASYRAQLPILKIVQDCFEGQEAILKARTKYLPKFEGETWKNYNARLAGSTYWNAYRRTVMGLVGMVHRKDPVLEPDVPQLLRDQCENVDLMGTHFDVFAKDAFGWSVAEGHCAILVDMPPPITATNPKATLADERGRRPYWSLYRKAQIINPIIEERDGIATLVQVTLKECVMKRKGAYGEQETTQYRVLRPGSWELFVARDKQGFAGGVDRIGEGNTSLDRIPLVLISTGANGCWSSRPALLDLAFAVLRHFRLQSALDCILQVANIPILKEIGGDTDGLDGQMAGGKLSEAPAEKPKRTISPYSVYHLQHGGDLAYVEHSGSAIGKAQDEIKTSRGDIARLGLSTLLESVDTSTTATENVIEWEAETSELAGMARSYEDGLESCLELMAQYQQLDSGGGVKVNRDFVRLKLDGATIMALSGMVAADQLPLADMYAALRNVLAADFDPKTALLKIAEQIAAKKAAGVIEPVPAITARL